MFTVRGMSHCVITGAEWLSSVCDHSQSVLVWVGYLQGCGVFTVSVVGVVFPGCHGVGVVWSLSGVSGGCGLSRV